ncbi:MAG: DUF4139 domain-containing protein [Anaerolineae bacterium]
MIMRRALRVAGQMLLAMWLLLTLAWSGVAQEATATPTPAPLPEQGEAMVTTTDANSIELTVYNQGMGLVKEVRTLDLQRGVNEVRFSNVAAQIDPTSVNVISLSDPQGTTVLEQNYEYDLVDSLKLLLKYVDQEILVRTVDGQEYTGTLLSGRDDVILATDDGIRILKLAQVQEFSFPTLPEGLITRPSLVWLLQAARRGSQDVRVTYLTNGMGWRADYVAVLAADDASLALNGWVTLDNNSGASYRDAKLKLVAGDLNRVAQSDMLYEKVEREMAAPTVVAGVEERSFFEYHLYEVQRPVTVKDNQTKQIEFVTAPQVAVEKVFVYEPAPFFFAHYGIVDDPGYGVQSDKKVQVRLQLTNDEDNGLGVPLPRGTVRVYKEDIDGGAELVGEDSIDHTAKDEDLSLYLGDAFDVVGERKQVRFRKLDEKSIEESYEITLRNHKAEAISVRVIEHLFRASDASVTESSDDYTMLDAHTAQWEKRIRANGEVTLTYTVVYRW